MFILVGQIAKQKQNESCQQAVTGHATLFVTDI